MVYFTGKGDKGYSLINNKRLSKDNFYLEILGELDEFNSPLGFLKNLIKDKKIKKEILLIQNDVFILQANIFWFIYPKFKKPKIKEERIKEIEKKIKEIEKNKKPQHHFFIISESNLESGILDYLKAKIRTLERKIVNFSKKKKIEEKLLKYINRLSSYFFALSRLKSKNDKEPWY
mgnify:CR=1 FL=1